MQDLLDKTEQFRWDTRKRKAAILVAEDELSDEEIASAVGVSRTTIWNWKQQAGFNAGVAHHEEDIHRAMTRLSIAKKHKRIKVLDDLHDKALQVIELRAERFTDADSPAEAARRVFGSHTVPEAATGLLVKDETITASGLTSTKWAVDTGLMKEIRALHEQAAKELGQWVERSESDVRTAVVQLVGVNEEDI